MVRVKVSINTVKSLIKVLGYKPEDGSSDVYYKKYANHDNYIIRINFATEKIEYRHYKIPEESGIRWGDTTTSNFDCSENLLS